MPRPKLPVDVMEFAKGLKAQGIANGSVKYPDGMKITWGDSDPEPVQMTELDKWKANRNAAS